MRALAALGRDNQLIAATSSAAILADAADLPRIDLSAGATRG